MGVAYTNPEGYADSVPLLLLKATAAVLPTGEMVIRNPM